MPQNVLPRLQTLELVSEQRQPLPQCVLELIPTMNSLHTLKLYGASGVHKAVQAVVSTNMEWRAPLTKQLHLSYLQSHGVSDT